MFHAKTLRVGAVIFNNLKRLEATLSDNNAALLLDGRAWTQVADIGTKRVHDTTFTGDPHMHRSFIKLIAAAAVAITTLGAASAPARADSEDTARALAAILGIAVLGAAIHDANKDNKNKSSYHRHPGHQKSHVHVYKNRNHQHGHVKRNRRYYEDHAYTQPKRSHHKVLPGRCLRSWHSDHGRVRAFGQRCLEKNHVNLSALPDKCYRRVWTDQGRRQGFSARCLNRHGYQMAHN